MVSDGRVRITSPVGGLAVLNINISLINGSRNSNFWVNTIRYASDRWLPSNKATG
jgi:hypothetical protein